MMPMGASRIVAVAAGALCVLAACIAQAQSTCTTRTLRSEGEVLSPYRPGPSPHAVSLVQGETLCLDAKPLAGAGDLLQPSLVESSTSGISLSLRYRDGRSLLEVGNSTPWPLWYDIDFDLADPRPLLPGRSKVTQGTGWVPGVILRRFRVRPPPPPPPAVPPDYLLPDGGPHGTRPFWIGISLILSVHHNQQDSLNRVFRDNGYSSIGTNQPIFGFAFDAGFKRFRFSWDLGCPGKRTYVRYEDGASYGVEQCFIGWYAGFDVFRYGGLSVFPMVGIALGDFQVNYDPGRPPMLRDQLSRYPDDTQVRRNLGAVVGLLGVEERIKLWRGRGEIAMLVLGLRLGYAQQFTQDDWVHENSELPDVIGGPKVDTSGPMMRVGIGILAQTGAW